LRSALYPAPLPAFREQVIHTSTHSKWGQLWKIAKLSPQKLKKIRDLFLSRFSSVPDHLMIKPMKAPLNGACRGWQTPYPQKRQQQLGATFRQLWKTAESRQNQGFIRGITLQKPELLIF